jgi:hypothetical protein
VGSNSAFRSDSKRNWGVSQMGLTTLESAKSRYPLAAVKLSALIETLRQIRAEEAGPKIGIPRPLKPRQQAVRSKQSRSKRSPKSRAASSREGFDGYVRAAFSIFKFGMEAS